MAARWSMAVELPVRFSQSLARRRLRPNQAKLRSTCGDRDPAGDGAKLGCDAGGWAVRGHPGEGAMAHYAAFDVSDKETASARLPALVGKGSGTTRSRRDYALLVRRA